MYRTVFWTLWEKARVGCFKRTASKHVYCLGWNRSPAQVGGMRQVLVPGALGRPREIRWRGRWEGGWGWGIHVTPCLIHVSVWQNPLQYCKVISLQLIKINEKKILIWPKVHNTLWKSLNKLFNQPNTHTSLILLSHTSLIHYLRMLSSSLVVNFTNHSLFSVWHLAFIYNAISFML